MDITDAPEDNLTQGGTLRHWRLLAIFIASVFLSAALLFAVQPMFTKMVLPRLGGAPSVWSVAMVFFQSALLAGYAYAHLLTRYVPGRASIVIHLALMIAAFFALPLVIVTGWGRPPTSGQAFWLLGLFAASIGLPFFALAANGPLLQAWFARSDHRAAKDPYFLYAASNVGSFFALISYPILIEPIIPLSNETRLWSIGFTILIVLIGCCGTLLWRSLEHSAASVADGTSEAMPPTWRDAVSWATLAAVPAGLLVAVTAHISTDVAAVPLLWVLPLALYLLTFVIVFQSRPIIPHWLAVKAQPFFILLLLVQFIDPVGIITWAVAIHIGVFFTFALVCHGELAQRRPAPRYLTAFYLWMSAGGMIGGIAAGLVAPYVFNWVAEYPVLIVLAVLCRPGLALPSSARARALLFGALAAAILTFIACAALTPDISGLMFKIIVGVLMALTVLFWRAPLPFAGVVAIVLAFNHLVWDSDYLVRVRSFFAVHKVYDTPNGYRVLTNGTTIHGAERIRDASGRPMTGRPELHMYYYDGSAMAQVMDAARARAAGPIRYAVIGLGAGSLACRATPSDTVNFYEIDPAIVRIARDPTLFHFLSECRPDVPIILGDARLTLADAPDGSYDIIYVDAFSSDAIPIHLLTSEVMALYFKKLRQHGILVMHVSNRHLELASVVTGIAAANGLITRLNEGGDVEEDQSNYNYVGTVTAIARNDKDFGALAQSPYWKVQSPDRSQRVWTDDYSNIIGAVLRRLRQ
jgi:hypothetical protein